MFDWVWEMGLPPPKVTFADMFKEVELRAQWLAGGGCLAKDNLTKRIGIIETFEIPSWIEISFNLNNI